MTKFGFLVASMVSAIACVSACGDNDSDSSFTSAGAGGGSSGAAGKGNGGSTSSSGGSGSKAGASNGGSGSNAGGSDGEAGNVGVGGSDGGAPSSGSGGADGGAPSSGSGGADGGAPGTGGAPACPDVFGVYDIASADGTCGNLDVDAMQEIAGTDVACFAHFVSVGDGPDGINGGAALDESGNFEGAMLYLDTAQRSPCSGSWNAGAAELTIECGGNGDLCTVVLERQ
jgi:hypothetical protein